MFIAIDQNGDFIRLLSASDEEEAKRLSKTIKDSAVKEVSYEEYAKLSAESRVRRSRGPRDRSRC